MKDFICVLMGLLQQALNTHLSELVPTYPVQTWLSLVRGMQRVTDHVASEANRTAMTRTFAGAPTSSLPSSLTITHRRSPRSMEEVNHPTLWHPDGNIILRAPSQDEKWL